MSEIPLWLVGSATAAALVIIAGTPHRRRLSTSLALLAFVLTVGQLRDLGDIASTAKMLSGPILLMVAFCAQMNPGPKRRIAIFSCLYLAGAITCLICVTSAIDWRKAVALRAQWVLLTVAAICVARTITDARSFRAVLNGLFNGVAAGSVLAVSALLIDPHAAFGSGHGRFCPYSCNPVQIGVLFALTAPLSMCLAVTAGGSYARARYYSIAVLASVAAILTVSRMAVGVIAIATVPSVIHLCRRPIVFCALVCVLILSSGYLLNHFEDADFRHLEAAQDSNRLGHSQEVTEEVSQRPWFGLFSSFDSIAHGDELNSHNTYVEMMYFGGFATAAPCCLATIVSILGTFCCFQRRQVYGTLLIGTAILFYLATVACGFVTYITFYPTYIFTFVHVMLCHFFILEIEAPLGRTKPVRPRILPRHAPIKVSPRPSPVTSLGDRRFCRSESEAPHLDQVRLRSRTPLLDRR